MEFMRFIEQMELMEHLKLIKLNHKHK